MSLSENIRGESVDFNWFLISSGLELFANPTLDSLVFAKFDADHGLTALAGESLVRASFQLVKLGGVDIRVERVSEVGHVLSVATRQFNH